jgi:hypothetical protein
VTDEHDHYPVWGDIEHQETDVHLVLSVSDALRLRSELPALARLLDDADARSPARREHRREAFAAVDRLLEQLNYQLRPFGSILPAEPADEKGTDMTESEDSPAASQR